jgi:prenyltransferase beta subunit
MKRKFTKAELAINSAQKAMAFAVQRVAEEHGRASKNQRVRDLCFAFYKLAEGCVECLENDEPFTIILSTQQELPGFDLSDEAYGRVE